ncbi:Vacuolar protein sorting-associated protein 13B [Acipenser ruthenus]|uniref:Vacuolar protein sorting-associated protein 13B n=1 Tax=Acipenser ruthenus TaxID=7906 RepID=A0A662YY03_ACIRT|nr:Vacuolar protein sorting-associated protein 13B [Acipenser ruthenus]
MGAVPTLPDFGTPTEGDSLQTGDASSFSDSATIQQKTTNIGGASGRVSLWMQWMLPKVTIKLFSPGKGTKGTEICVVSVLEDLSASVDVQDVYTKVKCKVGNFNIDHYKRSGEYIPSQATQEAQGYREISWAANEDTHPDITQPPSNLHQRDTGLLPQCGGETAPHR